MRNKLNRKIYYDEYVKINGIDQYLLHCGTSYENPVMLFLHCSGLPESLYAYKFQQKWEENFTIVHFDQRGIGKTFTKSPDEIPTVEKIIDDIHEIIKYLKTKYKKDKVIIFGHSLGTLLGSVYIKKYPEDVSYYIGTGQVINFTRGEHMSYEKVRELASKNKDTKTLAVLKDLGDDYPSDMDVNKYLKDGSKFSKLAIKYGLYENYMTFHYFKDVFMSPIFKWSDITALMKSGKNSLKLLDQIVKFNIWDYGSDYEVPIYYILGENDWQTPIKLAKEYFEEIKCPRKKIYMIPKAGHAAVLNEFDAFYEVLQDIRKREKFNN